jgi:hypothetical protein
MGIREMITINSNHLPSMETENATILHKFHPEYLSRPNRFTSYNPAAFYPTSLRIIPWPFCSSSNVVRAPRRSCSVSLLLANRECSPVPPSQTRGVLCFPLRPPSRKGATQEPEKSLASQLASTAELPPKITAELHTQLHTR